MSDKSKKLDLSCLDNNAVFETDPTLPRTRCDEALPLGNGLLGALIWMENDNICISLNRSDLWDERRPAAEQHELYNWQGMCKLIREKQWEKLTEIFRKSPVEPYPSILPGGRLEIKFPQNDCRFKLDEKSACAKVTASNKELSAFVPSDEGAVCRVKLSGKNAQYKLRMPIFEPGVNDQAKYFSYGTPTLQKRNNRQILALGAPDNTFAYALACDFINKDNCVEGVITVVKSTTPELAKTEAEKMLDQALSITFDQSFKAHKKAWKQFHSKCDIKFKDKELTSLWKQARYFFNCNMRKNAPPAGLTGVWSIDDGTLPLCRGDYHHNLNTQFTYLSYLAANDLEGGEAFLNLMANLADEHRAWAKNFYGVKSGLIIPGAMTLGGKVVPGIVNYTYHIDNGLWVAWMFYRHWRYTQDNDFLKNTAYNYLSEAAVGAINLAKLDENNKYIYDWHAFPEIGDEQPESYFMEMTSYVNDSLFAVLTALCEMAEVLDKQDDLLHWQKCLTYCRNPKDYAADYQYYLHHKHVLGILPGVPLDVSHRHHSHLMAFYPYDLLDIANDAEAQKLVTESIDQLDLLGTGLWVGFSLTWAAIMALRQGNARKALYWFNIYKDCFMGINGFYYNGDFKNTGCSAYKYRPFTLETIFAGQEFLQELVLSESGNVLKFFPGADMTGDAEFKNLRAPSAFIVSGKLTAKRVEYIKLTSEVGKQLKFANPTRRQWTIVDTTSGKSVVSSDSVVTFDTTAGSTYLLS